MQVMRVSLPADASCEDFEDEMPVLQSLSFLNRYVQDALQAGAAPYIPEEQRMEMGVVRPTALAEPLDTGKFYILLYVCIAWLFSDCKCVDC